MFSSVGHYFVTQVVHSGTGMIRSMLILLTHVEARSHSQGKVPIIFTMTVRPQHQASEWTNNRKI